MKYGKCRSESCGIFFKVQNYSHIINDKKIGKCVIDGQNDVIDANP
ncbi:hypothetical protein P343_05315 [Sporolactobacillus laevolacticus DSM 442]|uniref:Uncharacterized protein n=1 Tax=Sporolactobacillus laevolacticus DSM 442 TaxID=1395513 RepID=V6J0R9_9BACL|nr:hypothetical protein P343_05315 [Sporolactobacillus laevolacticus DSM 442]